MKQLNLEKIENERWEKAESARKKWNVAWEKSRGKWNVEEGDLGKEYKIAKKAEEKAYKAYEKAYKAYEELNKKEGGENA